MAQCDKGYLCEVCGEEVKNITDSDLYLRYVTGEVGSQALLASPERHIRCNPVLAQFIVDDGFEPVCVEGPFDKRQLEPDDVARREHLVSRGWRRLFEIARERPAVPEYPLPEFRRAGGAE